MDIQPQIPMTVLFRNDSRLPVTVRVNHKDFEVWKGIPTLLGVGDTISVPTEYAQSCIVVLVATAAD